MRFPWNQSVNDCGIHDSKNLTFAFTDSWNDELKKTKVYLTGRETMEKDNGHFSLFANDKPLVSVTGKER